MNADLRLQPVHQCPRCPLRFAHGTELRYHLREDHSRTRTAASPPAPRRSP